MKLYYNKLYYNKLYYNKLYYMSLFSKKYITLLFVLLCILLLVIIFKWIHFFIKNDFISECFTNNDNNFIRGANESGKLTMGLTPQYSSLTSGYGTDATTITKDVYSKPATPNFGVNTWITKFNEYQGLFDQRYKPYNVRYMPNYKSKFTLTGEFMEDGPFPSN